MKKTLVVLSIFSSTFSQAQFFAEAGIGYGLPMVSDVIDYETSKNSGPGGYTWTYDQIKGSFGAGTTFGVNIGYMLNQYVGFGLNTHLLYGSRIDGINTETSSTFNSSKEWAWRGKMTRISPSIIFSASGNKIVPFARFGFTMGLGGKITYESEYSDSDGDTETESFEISEGTAFGFSAELGIQYKITEKLSIVGSINSVSMNWGPKHMRCTNNNVNGVDMLPSMTVYDKEVNFVESFSQNSSTPPNTNQPDEALKIYFPFSSYGLNIGVRFSL